MYYELHEAVKQLRRDHNAGCGDAVKNFVKFYKKWFETLPEPIQDRIKDYEDA